jgi:hypothetical protein
MKNYLLALFVAALSVPASAVTISFNDGTAGAAVGNTYAGQGVTFSNAQFDGFGCVGTCTNISGLAITDIGATYQPKAGNPIVITFAFDVSFVSIYGFNVGENGARLNAYNATSGGALVGFAQDHTVVNGVGADNNPLLQVSGSGIRRVELFQPFSTTTEGLLFDTLNFTPSTSSSVPEPSTGAMAVSALTGLLFAGRRLRRSK